MQFAKIMLFRRTEAGNVPLEVLQALELPMPDDVLEQLVCDHGTKWEFQQQYGHLNLHALNWDLLSIRADEILACSVYPNFTEWMETAADRTRVVTIGGWEDAEMPQGAVDHWQSHHTWMRAPVMLRGELVGSDRILHLVEGHTRVGSLRGLVEAGGLPASSLHQVWVGSGCSPSENSRWREVLRKERMPFLDWLISHVGDEGDIGTIASELIDAKYKSASRIRIDGNDLDSALAYADANPNLKQFKEVIQQAHLKWLGLLAGIK